MNTITDQRGNLLLIAMLGIVFSLALPQPVIAQEATDATAVEEAISSVTAEEPADEAPAQEVSAQEALVEADEPEATDSEADETELAAEEADVTEAEAENEATVDDEAVEEEAEPSEFAGLVERAPAFFGVLHPALVHFPIALWLFGALFVVLGMVIPSWGKQIPLACLICGTLSAVAGTITGWWYADVNGYDGWPIDWEEFDFAESLADGFVQHRWLGVGLTLASILVTFIAFYAIRTESKFAGAMWRIGLIVLALGVGYEGHLGGALIHSTSIEEAFVEWVSPE